MSANDVSTAETAQSDQNLVYSKEKIRRLRIILSVVAGILLVCLLATALYFIFSADDTTSGSKAKDAIDLEDVLSGQLLAKRFNGSWTTSGNLIYRENAGIVEYDVKTHEKTVLLANANHYVLYEKSADGQFLLLAKSYKKNFRYSYIAEYDILNISSGQVQPLTIQNEQRFLLMVQWAPVGNGLIINYERNLYYKPSPFAAEITITTDENPGILNGIPDWVYEEEVLGSNVATWFNEAGTQIAFIRFDDTPTHVINFPYYGEAGDLRYQYPFNHLIAYPKAGSSNPRVELFTADLERAANGGSSFLTQIPVASALNTETDYIITVVSWLDKNNVLSVWMNRVQNLAYMQVFDGVSRHEIFNIESKTGWIDLFTAPFKNRNGSRIALILPQAQTSGDNFQHLTLLSTTSQSKPIPLTKGNYIVDAILHWDRTNDIIFYTANTEQNPETLHIYAIKATTDQTPKCLSCKLHTVNGVEQTYYAAEFNNANQVIITSQGPGVPIVSLYEWTYASNQVTLKKLVDWETNEVLRGKLKGIAMPTIEMLTIPISSGFTAKVLLQLPPNLDRSGKTKYPILVEVYGGPSSSAVVSRWTLDWGTYLSSNQSVIYAKIDGRGSNLRGEKLLHAIYLKLGTVEINDQIDVTQQLQEKYDFIDAEHTGIWGWSYGGYAAAMALANDEKKVFKCAASVAPVTDWTYYDSIYTERYMNLPEPNEAGYANSRLSTRGEKLRGKKYMLIHGTLDDNVHYQQSMILAKNLEHHDILFKQISYTDEDHGLANVRPHLYHSLDRFFGECFASNRLMLSAK